MAESRMLKSGFWDDDYVIGLGPVEKLVFLYFLFNRQTHICGVYQINLKYAVIDVGITREELSDALAKFEADGKMKHSGGWLAIRNWIKNQRASPHVRTGILK